MKTFLFFLLVFFGSIYWLKNWVTGGRMDAFLEQHQQSHYVPKALSVIAEIYSLFQDHPTTVHYYRWLAEQYPDHPDVVKARWQMALSYEDMQRKDLALEQYQILIASYSQTQEGKMSLARYSKLKY
ncbi:MAG: hypothetical protein HY610_03805 [Elusimicrobia bacterium]|nr:hypothetical protein [Elusimicrobiota bacterium]